MSLGRAVVITCSTRAASGVYPDRAGPLIVEALQAWGFTADAPVVVPDGARAGVPPAILSRGLAGLAGHTLVVNLPGSPGGVRDALAILAEVVPHAVDQVAGGDHRR